jgi:hypothetical protein
MPIDRPISMRVPMTKEEHRMVRQLAEHEGLTATALVRGFLRREHARIFGAKPTTKRGKR